MKRTSSRTTHEGEIVSVRIDEFEYDDGETAEREIVAHPGAVAIVAHDEERLFMVRQPREPVGEESLLELPAGKLDEEGETPLQCAKRELVEEVGIEAAEWRELKTIYTSPGFSDEQVAPVRCHRPDPGRPAARPRASGSRSSRFRSQSSTTRSKPAPTPSRWSGCCCA